jgi:hypothetical protein
MIRIGLAVLCVVACSKGEPRAKPKTLETGSGSASPSCGAEIVIDPTGVSIGTRAGACRAARVDGKPDLVWVEAQLRRLKWALADCTEAVVVAETGPYHELIALMDVAVKTGFIDVGIGDTSDLQPTMANAHDAECKLPPPPPEKPRTTPVVQWEPKPVPRSPEEARALAKQLEEGISLPPPPDPKETLQQAPVIIVTKTEVTYQGKLVTPVNAVIKDPRALEPLANLLRKADSIMKRDLATGKAPADVVKNCEDAERGIRPSPGSICPIGLAILQADESTDMRVINAVIHIGKATGFDNILFAVKTK